MICPKCGHERSDADDPLIPEYQCPSCGLIYAKHKGTNGSNTTADSVIENIRKSRKEKITNISIQDPTSKTIQLTPRLRNLILLFGLTILTGNAVLNAYNTYIGDKQKAIAEQQRQQLRAEEDRKRKLQINAAQARQNRQNRLLENAAKANKHERQLAQQKAACSENAECTFYKISTNPQFECKRQLEQAAKYRYKWTDKGWFTRKFDRIIWKDNAKTTIIAAGDHLELENVFGAWQSYTYACYVRVSDGSIITIKASPGHY